jgi:predicted house-cleaning noncanonical NTP pyrophosphatase (MazG superfamily)
MDMFSAFGRLREKIDQSFIANNKKYHRDHKSKKQEYAEKLLNELELQLNQMSKEDLKEFVIKYIPIVAFIIAIWGCLYLTICQAIYLCFVRKVEFS